MKRFYSWLLMLLPLLGLFSCNESSGDFERALEKERQLVAFLQDKYPAYKQIMYGGVGTTQYYVSLIEGAGDHPVFDQDYIVISYRTWKMDNYTNWVPNDADLLNTSDSTESEQKLVIRNYLHGGPELYPIAENFPEFGIALSKMKKGGKIRLFIAPSVASGFLDYTRVMDITLTDIIPAVDFDTTQYDMMEAYRLTKEIPEEEVERKHLITTSSSAITIGSEDGQSYIVLDPFAGDGYVHFWVETPGTGPVIADGSTINITSLSYGYLQKGRNVANLNQMSYIPVGHNLNYPDYEVGEGYKLFGEALDEILKGQREGVKLHVFSLSKFAFGWAGKVTHPENNNQDAFSTFLVPPGVPVVFDVTVGF